ncbi:MAG: ribokinase [Acidimicrobiales bacterium]
MTPPPDLVVVGSANLDIVVPVDRHPARGETVLGGDHTLVAGGKGANQAVAAARLGAAVGFVGRIGNDSAGEQLRSSLEEAGVELTGLGTDPRAPSGVALITVDPEGDNAIVVSPGANSRLRPDDVAGVPAVRSAKAVLLQLEIPLETVVAAAREADGLVVLDPAPAPESIPEELFEHVDLVVPNETELARLTGLDELPEDIDDIARVARSLPVPRVVVSLGARGALVVDGDHTEYVSAAKVTPIDTTAAGDAFRAAISVSLTTGADLVHACRLAVRVGAATTLRAGAQPSLPTLFEVDELLGAS